MLSIFLFHSKTPFHNSFCVAGLSDKKNADNIHDPVFQSSTFFCKNQKKCHDPIYYVDIDIIFLNFPGVGCGGQQEPERSGRVGGRDSDGLA